MNQEFIRQNVSLNFIINSFNNGLLRDFDDISQIKIIHNTHKDIFIKIIEVDIEDYLKEKLFKTIATDTTFNTISNAEHNFYSFVVFAKSENLNENNQQINTLICSNLLELIMLSNYINESENNEESVVAISQIEETNNLSTTKSLYNILEKNWSILIEK